MKATGKTKKELLDEIALLKQRISALEKRESDSAFLRKGFGEKIGRYFPQSEHLNEAVYVIFDRKYEFVNEKFSELFGVTPEEVYSSRFDPMTLVAPESRPYIHTKFREGFFGDFITQQYEYTGQTKDGARIECETYVLLIPYKWGVAFHGMLRDISVRKRIDEELQRHRSDLQIVLNSIPTSVFYTDRDNRFFLVNEAFCTSLGLPAEQVLGRTLPELFPHVPVDQLSHFFEVNEKVLQTGKPVRGFIEVFPSLRGRRWIQNDRMPYRDEAGNITGVICLALDISDLRETEDKLLYLSFHDVLTGYYNRTFFEEELARLENGRQFPISIVTVRVDDLGSVNKRDGIAYGNELLRRAAAFINIFRTEDVIARIGGDTFAVLLPLADMSIGERSVLRLREALKQHNSSPHDGLLQLSFGVATGEKGCSLSEVLNLAEAGIPQ